MSRGNRKFSLTLFVKAGHYIMVSEQFALRTVRIDHRKSRNDTRAIGKINNFL
jgi:hypothetical protein